MNLPTNRIAYERRRITDYGSIAEHTFQNPGGHVKGCVTNCHLDSFGEQAGNPHSP